MKLSASTLPAPGMAAAWPPSPPVAAARPGAGPRGPESMTLEVSVPVTGHPASAHTSRLADEFARVLQGQGAGKDAVLRQQADAPGMAKAANAPNATSAANGDDAADAADGAEATEPVDAAGVSAAGLLDWPLAFPVCNALVPPPPSPSSSATAAPAAAAALAASAHAVTACAEAGPASAATPTTVAQPDSGLAWELSIAEPGGLVLSLRAERVAAPASATTTAPPAWSLAINAPAAEAAALQRHAPRLAERLAARALAPAHVRIAAQHESQHGD